MTQDTSTQQPGPPPGPPPPAAPSRLVRRRQDGRIAGVASGLGAYVGVDPVVFRVAFVVLAVVNGIGVAAYLLAWLIMPEGDDADEATVPRAKLDDPSRLAVVGLVFVGLLAVGGFDGWHPPTVWGALLIGAGVLLFRQDGGAGLCRRVDGQDTAATTETAYPDRYAAGTPDPRTRPAAQTGDAAGSPDHAMAAWPEAPPPAPPPARPRSLLGGLAVAALLLAAGGAVLLDRIGAWDLTAGSLLALLLTMVGVALLIGTRWGRARGLIALGLVLLLALGLASRGLAGIRLSGGFGDQEFQPATVEDLPDEYRLFAGELLVDLSELALPATPVEVTAGVSMGVLTIVVPADATVAVTGSVAAGEARVLDDHREGIGVRLDSEAPGRADGGTLRLVVEQGLGEVVVRRAEPAPRGEGLR